MRRGRGCSDERGDAYDRRKEESDRTQARVVEWQGKRDERETGELVEGQDRVVAPEPKERRASRRRSLLATVAG